MGGLLQAVPEHVPVLLQTSPTVVALPSLQALPAALTGLEQVPVEELQVPAVWHWSEAVQVTGLEPKQVPLWQVSVRVQALLSLQAVPLALAGLEQVPVDGLQAPAVWHWSEAVQGTGLEPREGALWQVSVWVQESPSLRAVSFAFGVYMQVPLESVPIEL